MNNKNVSVLIYNGNEPLPKQGGMERITDSLARGLSERGIKTTLLCSRPNRLGEKYNAPVPIYYFPLENKKRFLLDLLEEQSITHIIDQTEGGIIGRFGIFDKRSSFPKDITLIAVQHNSSKSIINNFNIAMGRDYNGHIKQTIYDRVILPCKKIHSIWLIKKLYRELNQNYDKIVMLSESFIDDFLWFYKDADRRKLLSIPNMNSFNKVNNIKKEKRVLFVGRLNSRVKGCDKLLRIWESASKNTNDWHLDIVGDGPDMISLQKQAKEIGLRNYTFHGFKDPRPFYEKAKIFCMCSIYEGFGLVLTEAMQHGVIPMAFNSYSCVGDIINNGKTGFLIQPFDEENYTKTLIHLMNNNYLQNTISENAKLSVKKFSTDNVIKQWIELLDKTNKHN